jgi:hypothetical protein
MAFVENILTPLLQALFYAFIFFGGLFVIWFNLRTYFPYILHFIKYKIFRKKYDEKKVEWCYSAINKGYDEVAITKLLLLKRKSMTYTTEMVYIFREINKKLKGGIENK